MGESKRKRKLEAEFRAATCEAAYRPARTLLVCDLDAGDDAMLFEALVQARAVGPSALDGPGRTGDPGDPGPDLSALMDWDAGAACWDEGLGRLRPATGPERAMAGLPGLPMVRYAPAGPAVTYLASHAGGLLRADRAPVADPVAELRGLLRLGPDGAPVAEADAPLYLQYAELLLAPPAEARPGGDPGALDVELPAHLLHLASLYEQLRRAPCRGRGAWIDEARYAAMRAGPDDPGAAGEAPELWAWNVVQDALEPAARHGADRVSGRLGPRLRLPPGSWVRRDSPGLGLAWAAADLRAAAIGPGAPRLGNRAEMAILDADGLGPCRAYLSGLGRIAGEGDEAAYRDGDLTVLALSIDGRPHLAANPPGPDGPPLRDPLMTEDLGDVDLAVLDLGAPSPPATGQGPFAGSPGVLDLILSMADPDALDDYPARALLKAEAEGATLADLCAAYAEAVRHDEGDPAAMLLVAAAVPGGDVDARASADLVARLVAERRAALDRLLALGGRATPRLAALFEITPAVIGNAAVERDVRLLLDAIRAGAGLLDLARECAASGLFRPPARRAVDAVPADGSGPTAAVAHAWAHPPADPPADAGIAPR